MIDLKEFLTANETILARHVRELAENHGFTGISVESMPWRRSVASLTEAILMALESAGLDGCHTSSEVACDDDQLAAYALETSRRHRKGGLSLSVFMAVLKFYRQAYLDLLREQGDGDTVRERAFVNRVFDRMEISQCSDWIRFAEEEKLLQTKASHQALTAEKNRFLALFDSLIASVFLIDADLNIEIMNKTAFERIRDPEVATSLRYARPSRDRDSRTAPADRKPLGMLQPWLHDIIDHCRDEGGNFEERRFDTTRDINGRTHYFSISVSPVDEAWSRAKGATVVVEDVTERAELEQRLARERDMAAEYLDVVGAIVLAVDISGAVLLLNQTGCDIIGYDSAEITGRDWVETAIPEEERDELRDYYYSILADNIQHDDMRTNHIVTRDGEPILVEWNNRLLRNEGGIPVGVLSSGMDVTERRLMEAALEEKELWLRNTFVALNEAVLILTPDRAIMDANPAAEVMFQRTREELTELSIDDLHTSQSASNKYGELTRVAFEQGRKAEFEFVLARKDGSTFPTDNSVSLIANDDGTPIGVVNVIRDISRRKRAEMVLRESEEKFRRIFESMKDGFIVADLGGIIQMVNPATCDMLGYKESDLVGQGMSLLYANPDDRVKLLKELQETGTVNGAILSVRKKDKSTIMVEGNAHIVNNDDGIPIAMEGTFRDITARLEAEKMLREREKLYRAFFENNHAVMLLVDPKSGEIVDANPAASEFYGYSIKKMRTMNMEEINALTEEEIFQEMFSARNEKRSYFLFRHTLSNGDVRDVEVYSGPILVRGKQLLYSVIHDVTTRIRLERDMKRMATTDALTGANNRHQFFLMAHQEFNKAKRYGHPLGVIMLDIDYFKSINDNHGHQTGDEVLQALAATARETLRQTDIFGRLGGEEFAAVLPETDEDNARNVAERLRTELANLAVASKDELISFTVSVGVTILGEEDETLEEVLNRADESLYKAKRGGRNRVVVG